MCTGRSCGKLKGWGRGVAEGFIGMEQYSENLERFYKDLSNAGLRDALYAAAEIFRKEFEARTPVVSGQAQRHAIIYQRQKKGYAIAAEELALLVGYEKKHAYYMYWYEYGTSKQPARPFMRQAYDSVYETAYQAAENALKNGIG
jgi:HK97 gp10 family phage protein